MPLSERTENAVMTCALRFNRYAFESRRDGGTLADLSRRFVESLCTSDDPAENLAAFFALQRFLGKWGGEQLGDDAREQTAYRLLFLHLYRTDVPPDLRLAGYHREWHALDADAVEHAAAEVRESLAGSERPAAAP